MRILVLANVPPGTVGGAEVQALRLAHRWSDRGHRVLVAGTENKPFVKDGLEVVRVPTLKFTRPARGMSYLFSALHLMWRLRNDYDLVYCRFLKEQAIAAGLAKGVLRLAQPIIANPGCASDLGDVAYLLHLPLGRLWINLINRYVDGINVMTSRIEEEIVNVGLGSKVCSRIPNGVVLTEQFDESASSTNSLRVVFIGRLTEQKGVDRLIEAAQLLDAKNRSFSIRVVGDGHLRASLESRCHSVGLADRFQFVGSVPPADVHLHLRWADLFVLPSRSEGMPGALIEAMAHGLPVVATRVSGSEDIVEPSFGWLVPPDDPSGLARALDEATRTGQPQLRKMGLKARLKAESEHDISKIADRYLALFEEVVGKYRRTF